MNQKIELWLQEIKRKHGRKKIWMRVLSFLMAVTVFSTTYALILPAITMDKTYCGIEEHVHSVENGCYTEHKTLICTQEETEEGGHTHTGACYEEQSSLTCTLSESEGHAHGEACYDEEGNLICVLEESEGHQHSQDCYQTEQALVCGQQESEAAGHVHTDTCYETTLELTCEKEEHQHTKACYSNPEADVETAAVWESSLEQVRLTGVWADDVLSVADSQLGYTESVKNYKVEEDETIKGYTRYGAWYGDSYGDWCAMFVSFCLNYAQVDRDLMPIEAGCENWVEKLSEMGIYHRTGNADDKTVEGYVEPEEYMPEPGDLIFFDWDKNADADHVGLVYELIKNEKGDVTQVKTIEGNSGDTVRYNTYDLKDETILGYGELPENPNPPAAEKLEAVTENGITVTMTIPEGAFDVPAEELELSVEPMEDAELASLIEENAEKTDTETAMRKTMLFDIKVLHNGTVLQPKAPVQVTFSGIEAPSNDAEVFHVNETENKAENMNASTDEDGNINIEADGFSPYGITWTVDFHNGDVTFSIAGESEVMLSTIFEKLNIERKASDVVSVEFTDPELIKIEKDGEDWKLTSLQSFETEETLTITFKDGEIYKIKVTDPPSLGSGTANKVVVTGTVDNFYNGIPFANGFIDNSRFNSDHIEEYKTNIPGMMWKNSLYKHQKGFSYNGTVYDIPDDQYFEIIYNGAYVSENGERKDLTVRGENLHIGKHFSSGYFYNLYGDSSPVFAHGIDGAPSTLNGDTNKIELVFSTGSANDEFYLGINDIDVVRDSDAKSECVWINSGALSKAYIPRDNVLRIENINNELSETANGLIFYSTIADENTFNSGFALIAGSDCTIGFQGTGCGTGLNSIESGFVGIMPSYKVYNSAGTTTDWIIGTKGGSILMTDTATNIKYSYDQSQAQDTNGDGIRDWYRKVSIKGKNVPIEMTPAEGYYLSAVTKDEDSKEYITSSVSANKYNASLPEHIRAFYLPITGSVVITKVDEITNEPVTGAEFTISGTSSVHGAFTLTSIDNGDGTYTINNVPYGEATDIYTIEETKVPQMYTKAPNQTITGDRFNTNDITVPITVVEQIGVRILTVSKDVPDATANFTELFEFDVDIVNGTTRFIPADGTYSIVDKDGNTVQRIITKAANGRLTVSLGNGEKLVVTNVTAGYTAHVTEAADDRYNSGYIIDPDPNAQPSQTATPLPVDRTVSQIMDADHEIRVVNERAVTDLTVKKTVVGGVTDTFSFRLTPKDAAVMNSIPEDTSVPAKYTKVNGAISFDLKGGEEVTIPGIPVGAEFTLTETSHDGYSVSIYDITAGRTLLADKDTAEVTLSEARTIEVQNNPGVELPSTGGIGTHIYTIGGLLLIFAAAVVFVFSKRRRERNCE